MAAALCWSALLVTLRLARAAGLVAAGLAGCVAGRSGEPVVQREDRKPLSDIVSLVVDESASQRFATARTNHAVAPIEAESRRLRQYRTARRDLGRRRRRQRHHADDRLSEALAEEPAPGWQGDPASAMGSCTIIDRAPDCPRRCTCC